MKTIHTIKIHPAIGIARLGNSPTGFFIGPEKPGAHTRPKGGYKDAQGRIKRQAARFRLFGYDSTGKLVKEITATEARIRRRCPSGCFHRSPRIGTGSSCR